MIPNQKTNKLYLSSTLRDLHPRIASDIEKVCSEFNFTFDSFAEAFQVIEDNYLCHRLYIRTLHENYKKIVDEKLENIKDK